MRRRERLLSGFVEAVRGGLWGRGRALIPLGREFEASSQFITLQEKTMGEAPQISIAAQMAIYLADPMARSAVDFLAEQVAGPGFYTTARDEGAKGLVDDFCAHVNMDELLLTTAREVVAFGNCFWERTLDGLKPHVVQVLFLVSDQSGRSYRFFYKITVIRPGTCWVSLQSHLSFLGILYIDEG